MKAKFLNEPTLYDGSQLRSMQNYLKHELLGDSVIAWIGPCNVSLEHMVDGEDRLAKQVIRGEMMLHFIVELFDSTLLSAVAIQRLLSSLALELLREVSPVDHFVKKLRRDGDDIFCGQQKLSISIATQSPINSLIHFAVNVVNQGTPVPTISLAELKVEPKKFAEDLMSKLCKEVETIKVATQKVMWVR